MEAEELQSWAAFERVATALRAPGPSTYIVSENDHQVLSLALRVLLECHVADECWPSVVSIDCHEVREARHLYDRVLDGFAAWPLRYNTTHRGVETWNGRGVEALGNATAPAQRPAWRTASAAPTDAAKGVLGDHANVSFPAFAAALTALFSIDDAGGPRRILILTHAERLALVAESRTHHDSSLLVALTKLAQDTLPQLSIVMVASSATQFASTLASPRAIIEVPPFRHEDLTRLLCMHYVQQHAVEASSKRPLQPAQVVAETADFSVELQQSLAQSLADQVIQAAGRSLITSDTLRISSALCTALWSQWSLPVQRGVVRPTEIARLTNAIKEPLKVQLDRLQTISVKRDSLNLASLSSALSGAGAVALLAVFIASHNASRTDMRIFATSGSGKGPQKRRRVSPKKEQDSGPKAVPLERVQAIYTTLAQQVSLQDESTSLFQNADGDFHMQIASLVSASLVLRTSPERLDVVKLKAAIQREEAGALAKKVTLVLDDWLAT